MTAEEEHSARLQSWLDQLSEEGERSTVAHVLALEGGTMATAFLALGQFRLEKRMIELEKRSIFWKDAAKVAGALGATLAAGFAGWHNSGLPKP